MGCPEKTRDVRADHDDLLRVPCSTLYGHLDKTTIGRPPDQR